MAWGSPKATVKNYEKREFWEETEEYLYYYGENADVSEVAYGFKADRLQEADVWLNNTANIETRVMEFLNGRHQYYGEDMGCQLFVTADGKTAIGFEYVADYQEWVVWYVDMSLVGKSPFPINDLKKVIRFGLKNGR
jgi:hypothetical protein